MMLKATKKGWMVQDLLLGFGGSIVSIYMVSLIADDGEQVWLFLLGQLTFSLVAAALGYWTGRRRGRRKAIDDAPGWVLLRLLQWVYSHRTVSQVFQQAVNDMQHEHIEALADGR